MYDGSPTNDSIYIKIINDLWHFTNDFFLSLLFSCITCRKKVRISMLHQIRGQGSDDDDHWENYENAKNMSLLIFFYWFDNMQFCADDSEFFNFIQLIFLGKLNDFFYRYIIFWLILCGAALIVKIIRTRYWWQIVNFSFIYFEYELSANSHKSYNHTFRSSAKIYSSFKCVWKLFNYIISSLTWFSISNYILRRGTKISFHVFIIRNIVSKKP